jgi:hypothetical protein
VAAGRGSGSSWRSRARPGREGTAAGKARGDAWACVAAGGGAQGPMPAVSGGGRAEQREGSGGARGRRSRQESEGLVRDFQRVQGPLCNLKFLTATRVK